MKILTEPKLTNLREHFGEPASEPNPLLERLGEPHLDSFNYILEDGLSEAIKNIVPVNLLLANGSKLSIWFEDVRIHKPMVPNNTLAVKNSNVYPTECRQRGCTYKGKVTAKIGWSINGLRQQVIEKDLGEVPVMVKSKQCHLYKKDPKELIDLKEHEEEWGGYFVIKGHERLIRMLLMTRRNYPVAVKRPSWKQRGALFSDLGILLRGVRDDNTACTNTLHYVTDGTVKLMFSYKKVLYYVPLMLILKCLMNVTDVQIFNALTAGSDNNTAYKNCILSMLRAINEEGLKTHEQCKAYLGKMFRVKLLELSADSNDTEFCDFILKYCILINHDDPIDKFNLLIYMTKKLYTLADNKCAVEGVDAVMMQECLLGGHLYLQVLKEKLYGYLIGLRAAVIKRGRSVGTAFALTMQEMIAALKHVSALDNNMEHFLSTGSIRSPTGLGLMQSTGLTIVAENINRMRYMSHFRAIHRGSFFQEMRTTEARQLLPDAWGFICPVHTPDGAPCGLLNHLAMNCVITKHPDPNLKAQLPLILTEFGMTPYDRINDWTDNYTVMLDGKLIGFIGDFHASRLVDKLRVLKINEEIPATTEIVFVPKLSGPSQYPGLFLFTGPARMMRPVINLSVNKIELIGTFEQVYLNVAITDEDVQKGNMTHKELENTAFLSNLAQLIPLPDFNQSPRNMYQCQMGKQTMGTPCHTWQLQSETKLYRLQTPATPLFRPVHYDNIGLDSYPMGTNAVVAVISYTGYDMEDAMIINKSSYERGFAHGMIYHSEFVDLPDAKSYFFRDPENDDITIKLQANGLPSPGTILVEGDPLYSYYDSSQSRFHLGKYYGKEQAYVDSVKLCGNFGNAANRACITYRIPRNPSVGDKFASRAGQKGICSQKWPAEDLPFTDSGMIPDILFNPHGFPSRMTIAMIVEMLAGKSAASHGLVHDATPFKFDEENTAAEYFGELLKKAGFNYYGTEQLYSGIHGEAMTVDIFFGIVHYQRLRHMVSDKWQVRSTGPVDQLTGQPIKGRKKGGGIRFGEMERDSLISHGCAFLLQDRLFNCSDKITALVCTTCGTLVGPEVEMSSSRYDKKVSCKLCKEKGSVDKIYVPYIFRFLAIQLMSCNINIKMSFIYK